jgi:V/A-type H+-transporting ATPase subunit A
MAVKRAIKAYREKPRPFKLLETGVRTIDTLNPIVEGGTGFIPGPFGSGKTVMQQAISKQAEADVVIVAACGERANEVVELFTEFPELDDPCTGRKLMERTVIIANTSNMPVAAREASVYTAMTISRVLPLDGPQSAAARRLDQPLGAGPPRNVEPHGGTPRPRCLPDGPCPPLSPISTPGRACATEQRTNRVHHLHRHGIAGGRQPQGAGHRGYRKAARCFYALSQQRADSKRYPAIDPIDSYSKYLEYPEAAKDAWPKPFRPIG